MAGAPPAGFATGTAGFPGILGAPGFAPIGGGFGLLPTAGGGGLLAKELPGRDPAGLLSPDPPFAAGVFFQGAAEPFAAGIPGKTETGFADALAVMDLRAAALGVGLPAPGVVDEAPMGGAGGRRPAGGGGGGAGAAFGFGGISSK